MNPLTLFIRLSVVIEKRVESEMKRYFRVGIHFKSYADETCNEKVFLENPSPENTIVRIYFKWYSCCRRKFPAIFHQVINI